MKYGAHLKEMACAELGLLAFLNHVTDMGRIALPGHYSICSLRRVSASIEKRTLLGKELPPINRTGIRADSTSSKAKGRLSSLFNAYNLSIPAVLLLYGRLSM